MDQHLKSILAIIVTVCIMAAILIGIIFVAYQAVFIKSPESEISTIGVSQIKATPDIVGIYYGVETNGTSAADAGGKNSEIANDLIDALVGLGFARTAIQTESYSVMPDYIYDYSGRQTQIGFKAVNQMKLQFPTSDTRLIGDAIDAGINAGANINYINFELSITKQNEYKTEALRNATEDARVKAEAMASGFGKSLGRIKTVSSSDFNYYPWRMYDAITPMNAPEAKAEVTSIQPSDETITAQVSVVYVLE